MTIFFFFWHNLDIYEQKSHDTIVILEIKKNIGIYITILSLSFFQKKLKKQHAYYGAQMGFSTRFLLLLSKIIMTMV